MCKQLQTYCKKEGGLFAHLLVCAVAHCRISWRYQQMAMRQKKYYQRIDLPQDVNTDTLKSNYVNGILEIEFGKKQKLADSLPPVAKKNKNQKMSRNRRQKARAK
jgi:hypothetical protein